jgi:hypothetical protein
LHVGAFKLGGVGRSVVRRQPHAGQNDNRPAFLQLLDHLAKVLFHTVDGQGPQAVVAAELHNDEIGCARDDGRQTRQAHVGSVTADTFINHAERQVSPVDFLL